MDALKSYSGEESSSEDEVEMKDLNDSSNGQDKKVVGDPKEYTAPAVQQERDSPPPSEVKKKEEEKREVGSQSGHGHRRQRSRSRSRSRDPSPSDRHRESSRYKRSRDYHKQQSASGSGSRYNRDRRGYERRRSRSRSRSPPSYRRRGSYNRRKSRSRSPTYRRRRSRSPDYRHQRGRSSSSDRRGSRRRSGSPTERGSRDEEKVRGDGGLEQRSKDKTETTPTMDNNAAGLSTTAQPQPTVPGQTVPGPTTVPAAPPATTLASPGVVAGQATYSIVQPNPAAGVTGGVSVPLLPPPDLSSLTPEQRLELILAANRAKGPQLPTFMNPTAINPLKFQQIKEKRKLLWSSKKTQKQSHNQWEAVSLGTDDKDTAKFRRLMGISSSSAATSGSSGDKDVREEHSKRLNVLEQQYESSRYQTHIARGVGLGYGSAALTTELPSEKDSGDKLDEKL